MISLLTTGCKIVWFSVVLSRTGVDWGFNNLCRSNHQGQVSGIMSVHGIHILLVATTCPHVWQKHVLSANQNSEFWQSNFEVYPPTLECFGATPQTVEWKQSRSATHPGIIFVFGVLKIRMNEVYSSFYLDAYSTLHRKTLIHILLFRRCVLCDFFHDILNNNNALIINFIHSLR